jgi:hypothetical protein
MGTARWSDSELREFIRRLDTSAWWRLDDSAEETETARLRAEIRDRVAPVVQRLVLERVGTLVEPEGVAIVAADLIQFRDGDERRWLLVTPDPWGYLAQWIAAELASSYKDAKGTPRARTKELKRLEKSLEA